MPPRRILLLLLLGGLALGEPAARAEHIVAACIGDFGRGGKFEANVAKLVKSWKPDVIVTVGDNNYPRGAAETIDHNIGQFYHEFIAPYKGTYGAGALSNRFFPALGNHDWMTNRAKPYLDYFTLPGNERYYTFPFGPVRFFCLDSDKDEPDGIHPESRQGQWLKKELGASTSAWQIVYFHHAPYSSGILHGSQTKESDALRWPFKEWGAHAVLTGHDHTYERLRVDGLTYFVNGLGGESFDKFYRSPIRESLKRFTGTFGAMRIDATETNLTFRFITSSGNVVDTHVLFKPSAARGAAKLGVSFEVIEE
jgi:tartrate-resistant acid phosphatase type 5